MADVHTEAIRSYNMSRIKSKDTKPEIVVRKFLFSHFYRYRLHSKRLPGKPDIVLAKLNTVIFVHGCFWHGHTNCSQYVIPKTRRQWWLNKINRNRRNDRKNIRALKNAGWHVQVIWSCQLISKKRDKTLQRLVQALR